MKRTICSLPQQPHFSFLILNATGLLTGIAVPTCGGWVLGENCWNKQGNVSDFERFLFPK